jgi:membrane dipeptidase
MRRSGNAGGHPLMPARSPVVDGHNDLPWEMRVRHGGDFKRRDLAQEGPDLHTDIPRLRRGGVGAQFWSVYVPAEWAGEEALRGALEQIAFVHRMVAAYPAQLALAGSSDEVVEAAASGHIACLIGAEGGHAIAGSLGALWALHRLGVRYMTLTHNKSLEWADSATDEPRAGGLSEFGLRVVEEMQRLGMLVDLSHVAESTMAAALDAARAPVIFSHSSSRHICDHPRNVPDHILQRLAANGGVCMVTFVPQFVSPRCRDWALELEREAGRLGVQLGFEADSRAPLEDWLRAHPAPKAQLQEVADHLDHMREVAGLEHVGLGGDFDGTQETCSQLEDVSAYPRLLSELARRRWSEDEIRLVAGGNVLRALRAAEEFAGGASPPEPLGRAPA